LGAEVEFDLGPGEQHKQRREKRLSLIPLLQ
jgi:hypothetical protein